MKSWKVCLETFISMLGEGDSSLNYKTDQTWDRNGHIQDRFLSLELKGRSLKNKFLQKGLACVSDRTIITYKGMVEEVEAGMFEDLEESQQ